MAGQCVSGCRSRCGLGRLFVSFKTSDWTRTHARQPELLRYIEEALDDFGLRQHCRFNSKVERAVRNQHDHTYSVELVDGSTIICHVLISAVGLLNHPRHPDWPGLEDFKGPKFHTARWEHQHKLPGKRVAVVGTGSTASQIVPSIAPEVGHLTLFQREAGWVIPKGDRDLSAEERAERRNKWRRRWSRIKYLSMAERSQIRAAAFRPGSKTNLLREQICRDHIAAVFKDRPDLAKLVTPSYPYGGKRNIINGDFYPALLRDNVELVPHAVISVTENGVIDATGVEHQADVLVMSTGFQPTNFLATFDVIGRNGQTLREAWNGEPRAFLGITVPGFPNFYIPYGPNTNGGEIMSNLERQREYAIRRVKRMVLGRTSPPSRSRARTTTSTTGGCNERWSTLRGR
jgi:cation diffusion facilitator CzcD-associated flavoprotein CzcO